LREGARRDDRGDFPIPETKKEVGKGDKKRRAAQVSEGMSAGEENPKVCDRNAFGVHWMTTDEKDDK